MRRWGSGRPWRRCKAIPLGGLARVQAGQSAADLACAAIVAAIPLLYLASVFSFWQLLVLVFVLSCINMVGDSARYALIPGLAARARMPIEWARPTGRSPTSPRWWVRSWPAC